MTFLEWIQEQVEFCSKAQKGGSGGPYGFSLEYDGEFWTLKAWTLDSFAWTAEVKSRELEELPNLMESEM